MKIFTSTPTKVIFFFVALLIQFSCSKDSDLMADFILEDTITPIEESQSNPDPQQETEVTVDLASGTIETNEDTIAVFNISDIANTTSGKSAILKEIVQPVNGEILIEKDSIIKYIPESDYNGTDVFTYTVEIVNEDNTTSQQENSIEIEVLAIADVVNDVITLTTETELMIPVLNNDTFSDKENVVIIETSNPNIGNVVINSDQTLTYTPNPNEEGLDSFTYTTQIDHSDGIVSTEEGNIELTLISTEQSFTINANVTYWKEKFDTEWETSLSFYTNELSGNQSQRRYYDFRSIDGNIAMLQATGDTKYIDNIIWYIDRVKELASISTDFGDGYYDWEDGGSAYQLYDGHGLRNIFKFLWILKKYPTIRALSNYQAKYDEYLVWFTANLWDKWESRGTGTIMRGSTHMSSHMASNMALYLYLIEDEPIQKAKYLAWVTAWNEDVDSKYNRGGSNGTGFRDQIRIDPVNGGYVWAANWGDMTGTTDVSHSNAELQAVINQRMNGIGNWTDTDIENFIITLNAILDNSPSFDFREMPYRLDAVYDAGDDNGLFITYGWAMLGRFDQILQNKLETANTVQMKASKYYNDFLGVMAYNQAFLEGNLIYPEF